MEQAHRNHGLFSDHYLNATLPEQLEWKDLAEQARPVMEGVSGLFASFTPSTNEAQTEQDLVRPDLDLLGHDFKAQPALKTPYKTRRPNYALYRMFR
ncbi:MAG: hypothetical protein M3P49_08645 [Actinomycetota bacterium]|nr:hypothetical protein [Actinomycetota bacterium]